MDMLETNNETLLSNDENSLLSQWIARHHAQKVTKSIHVVTAEDEYYACGENSSQSDYQDYQAEKRYTKTIYWSVERSNAQALKEAYAIHAIANGHNDPRWIKRLQEAGYTL